ncbi:MAG: 2,3,4,5-tetrahydropyridine-2,6-dicarboxylate N-succinyltransferase [Polyangiaceae bacterium]
MEMKDTIREAYANRDQLASEAVQSSVLEAIRLLDAGELRVAEPGPDGEWITHAWVKEAILLYFAITKLAPLQAGPLGFFDKIPIKSAESLSAAGVRVVPPGTVRYGAFVERGAIVMPGYVNIGARVGSGTMVDTWATVGSCAQVGKDCHLSGGVGLGGVLEPPSATPVIVEDGCFVGSRAVIVEGVRVEREAVIGAGVVLTSSTSILDVRGSEPVELRGRVPARSVVIPGIRPKKFPAGEYGVPCALIIGERTASTDRKTSLNSALRDFAVAV